MKENNVVYVLDMVDFKEVIKAKKVKDDIFIESTFDTHDYVFKKVQRVADIQLFNKLSKLEPVPKVFWYKSFKVELIFKIQFLKIYHQILLDGFLAKTKETLTEEDFNQLDEKCAIILPYSHYDVVTKIGSVFAKLSFREGIRYDIVYPKHLVYNRCCIYYYDNIANIIKSTYLNYIKLIKKETNYV